MLHALHICRLCVLLVLSVNPLTPLPRRTSKIGPAKSPPSCAASSARIFRSPTRRRKWPSKCAPSCASSSRPAKLRSKSKTSSCQNTANGFCSNPKPPASRALLVDLAVRRSRSRRTRRALVYPALDESEKDQRPASGSNSRHGASSKVTSSHRTSRTPDLEDSSPRAQLLRERGRLKDELNEFEFDFQSGKLSETDYQTLKQEIEAKGAAVMQQLGALPAEPTVKAPKAKAASRHRAKARSRSEPLPPLATRSPAACFCCSSVWRSA